MDLPDNKKWEDAFIGFGFDAAVGRLFMGIIHNLNGVGQAFSMQVELLTMMFAQADDLLAEISLATSLEEAQEKSAKLRVMMGRRADLVKHLPREVEVLQETMQRASVLTEVVSDPPGAKPFKLDSVIRTEMEFLTSDGFFKHKIKKELSLADNVPALIGHRIEIHQILAALLENSSQALADNFDNEPEPEISIATSCDGGNVEIRITDNGPGIGVGDLEHIFEPFFSTREDHLGLGLYLARLMAVNSGGSLTCESSGDRTCFTLRMVVQGGELAN
ncbi:MAG: ATP-binding protein [Thermodesulfobacteriota bacterium]